MLEKIRQEPVMAVALVQAFLVLLIAFGVDITEEQITAILGVLSAALAASAYFVRSKTRSKRSLALGGSDGDAPRG